MNRRKAIEMSGEEIAAFLDEQRVVICASNGRQGWPHLMPLWYRASGGEVWAWTYAKSQKVRNVERDPRVTLQIEDGVQYAELRGVMIEAHAVIHRELDRVSEFGVALYERYVPGGDEEFRAAIRSQAAKRVALQFVPARVVSWDHRKLRGAY